MTSRTPWAKRPDAADAHRLRGWKGQQRRARWLSRFPLCKHCEAKGRVRLGVIVDHVVPLAKGGADDDSNLQTLCAECDKLKTAADLGHRIKPTTGLDGWPV
jgi:5-methylcytosine-specific restriction protein A